MAFLPVLFFLDAAAAGVAAQNAPFPVGAYSGVVVDVETQAPIVAASVGIVGSNQGTVTDEHGRFSLSSPSASSMKVLVRSIGYDPKAFVISAGVEHYLGLSPKRCEIDHRFPYEQVVVLVAPAEGAQPLSAVTLVVRGEEGADTANVDVPALSSGVIVGAGLNEPGVYTIEVSSPGFRTWTHRVKLGQLCSGPERSFLDVQLIPSSVTGG